MLDELISFLGKPMEVPVWVCNTQKVEKDIADLNEASGQEAFWSLSLLLLNFGGFSKVFLFLPAQTHSVRLWGTRQGRVLKSLPKMETWMDSLSQLSEFPLT